MGQPRTHEQLVSFAEDSTITQENRPLWWVYVVVSAMYRGRSRYFIYDYYYVPKHTYYILLYIIIIL